MRRIPGRTAIALLATAVTGAALLVVGFALAVILRDADTGTRTTTLLTFACCSIVALVAVLATGLYLGRARDAGLRGIARAADRIAGGDTRHRADAAGGGAAGELAHAVNQLADSLQAQERGRVGERDRFIAALDTLADGVLVVEASGRIAMANIAALSLIDARPEDIGQRDFRQVLRDPGLRETLARCQAKGTQQTTEITLTPGGQPTPVALTATPIPGSDPPETLVTLRDLRQTRRVESARREFVSNVSHELRSPIAAIRALAETLEDGGGDETFTRDYAGRILTEAYRMQALVDDLLELARIESGAGEAEGAPTDVAAALADAVARVQTLASDKGVSVEVSAPDGLAPVRASAIRVGQVLANLLENALKWTPPGGAIRVWAEAAPGGCVRVSVEDTGVGIEAEHLPHIFERFYKADRARRDGGAGLGLAIVKHIVQAYGGDANAQSQPGKGSVFTFTLPAV